MMPRAMSRETFRFADFVLDVSAYELRRQGRPVRLERRPMDLLVLLVQRRGQLVTRSDIVERLWGKDVFVDVETGVNTIMWKVRGALHDSSDAPAFVETVPGKGYRFIAAVEVVPEPAAVTMSPAPVDAVAGNQDAPAASAEAPARLEPAPAEPRSRARLTVAVLAVVLLAAFVTWAWFGAGASRVTLAVLPFENLSGDPEREYLADGLADETIAALGQIDPDHVSVIGRTSTAAYKRTTKSLAQIGQELRADYLVESSIQAEGGRLRIRSKLIRVRHQEHVWSASYDSEPTSILALQRELSTAIAEQIRLRLSPERIGALARAAHAKSGCLRHVPSWPELREPAHARDDASSNRLLPARDRSRSELRARLVRPCAHVLRKIDQQRRASARDGGSRPRSSRECGESRTGPRRGADRARSLQVPPWLGLAGGRGRLATGHCTRFRPPGGVPVGLGDRDEVFEWLDRAYGAHDVHLIFLPVDPKWDAYRHDPRFEALVARCGFARASSSSPASKLR